MRIVSRARTIVVACSAVIALLAAPGVAAAQVPLIRPAGAPTADIGRVAARDAALGLDPSADRGKFNALAAPVAENPAARVNQLVLFARANGQELFEAWQLQQQFPADAADRRAQSVDSLRSQTDSAAYAVFYALLAQRPASVDALVARVDSAARRQLRSDLTTLRETLDDAVTRFAGAPRATLFAKGDVKGVATGSDPAAAATGALGLTMETKRATLQASLTLASTADSLTSGYGAAVLTPGAGKALSSGLLGALIAVSWPDSTPKLILSLLPRSVRLYGTVASSRWHDSIAVAGGTVQPVSADVVTLGGGALGWYELACCRVLDNPAVLTFEVGVGFRHLGGNATADRPEFLALRDSTLGTRRRTFWGPEIGMQLTVNRVIGSLQLYHVFDGGDGDVPGLTGIQVVTAFTIAADIFTGPLTR